MKRILVFAGIVLLVFILGVMLANFIIMPAYVRRGTEITVPNVCTMPLDSAITVLKQTGLQAVVTERRYDPIIAEGEVIIQDPLPNAKVKKGRIVNLSVSLGVEQITVPFLIGLDFERARSILEKTGLAIEEVDSVYSDSVPAGKIVRTIPDADTPLKKDDGLRLVVSKGLIITMPMLVGMSLERAQDTLARLGLAVREIQETEGGGEPGVIVVQNPRPDEKVNQGDSVSLMVIK